MSSLLLTQLMIKKQIIFLTAIIFGLISCNKSNSKNENSNTFNSSLDSIRYVNYLNAIENRSTFQYFTVIKIKDLNNGNTREICTKGNFILGALNYEHSSKTHKSLLKNKERYFQFKDTVALNNLGVNNYSIEDLKKFEKENNIDSLAKTIKGKWGMHFSDDKSMLLFAHSLFNRGILTGENNCFGGTLIHVDKQILNEKRKRIEELKAMSKKK